MARRHRLLLLLVAIAVFVIRFSAPGLLKQTLSASADVPEQVHSPSDASQPSETFAESDNKAQVVLDGKRLFYSSFGNTAYACIYCHANFDEEELTDGYLRPAHSLWNSFSRESYFNGAYKGKNGDALIRAINTCLVAWLEVEPLDANDPNMTALFSYLESISPEAHSPAVVIEKQEQFPSEAGDARRGEKLYQSACILCHRENGSAPVLNFDEETDLKFIFKKVRGVKSELTASALDEGLNSKAGDNSSRPIDQERPSSAGKDSILSGTENVESIAEESEEVPTLNSESQHVQPSLKYGKMPFFPLDRLTDQELADILAYIEWQSIKEKGKGPIQVETEGIVSKPEEKE